MIPYVRWYPSDYLASAAFRQFSLEEDALYRRLLDIAWDRGPNSEDESPPVLPFDPEELAWVCGIDTEKFERLWEKVRRKFITDGSEIYNQRQMEEYDRAKEVIETKRAAGKLGARARHKASKSRTSAKHMLGKRSADGQHQPSRPEAHPSYPDPDPDPNPEKSKTLSYSPLSASKTAQRLWTRFKERANETPGMREPSTEKPSGAFVKAVKERLEESWTEELLTEAIDNYARAVDNPEEFFVPLGGKWPPAVLLSRKKGKSKTDELWLFDYVGETWTENARRIGGPEPEEPTWDPVEDGGWNPDRVQEILERDRRYDLKEDPKELKVMTEEEFEEKLREVDAKLLAQMKERIGMSEDADV